MQLHVLLSIFVLQRLQKEKKNNFLVLNRFNWFCSSKSFMIVYILESLKQA